MSSVQHLTSKNLEYYTKKLKVQIEDYCYDKDTIDKMLSHSAQAYYYAAAVWDELDPVLAAGEIGIDADNGFMKIGDGIHKWSEIDYAIFPVSLSQRGDNLLLKENNNDLFLGEAAMRKLMLDVINMYHSDENLHEFVTADGYTFLTADEYIFINR